MTCSVLVVDDDCGFRDLAVRVLTTWGHVVVGEAGSVAEALDLAVEMRPDVALVDVGLPDGDGISLASWLSKLADGPRVVLISSDPDRATTRAAKAAGASGFVPKDELTGPVLRRLLEAR